MQCPGLSAYRETLWNHHSREDRAAFGHYSGQTTWCSSVQAQSFLDDAVKPGKVHKLILGEVFRERSHFLLKLPLQIWTTQHTPD